MIMIINAKKCAPLFLSHFFTALFALDNNNQVGYIQNDEIKTNNFTIDYKKRMNFVKYHSLENDFILIDWYQTTPDEKEVLLVEKEAHNLCNRNTGIGADGIIVISNNHTITLPELKMFNADGTKAEICLNGLRCAAHYLYKYHKFTNSFLIMMNQTSYECEIQETANSFTIKTYIPKPTYKEQHTIETSLKAFNAHIIDMGNPHCVILENISENDLALIGPEIQANPYFPHQTNIESIWQDTENKASPKKRFFMNVFERGCGITRSCSSGVAACIQALHEQKVIAAGEEIEVSMPGGIIECSIDSDGEIILSASAFHVFSGCIDF